MSDNIELATIGLNTYREYQTIEAKLDTIKGQLRGIASGETLKIDVPGVGSVMVCKKPKEGESKKVITLNEKRLLEIPGLKEKLIAVNVIAEETKQSKSGAPAVKFELNT